MGVKANLFVIGAMKSGSTTLHDCLAKHPDIHMTEEKEPGYFVPELWDGRAEQEYAELLAPGENKKYVGESSTHYTKLPTYSGVPEKMHAYNPSAKILYVMRQPIARLISHYYHNVRDLYMHGESRSIQKAIQRDPAYIAYSDYAYQLRPYYELFGEDKIYILTFEDLVSDQNKVMSEIFAWLGVDADCELTEQVDSNKAPKTYRKVRGLGLLNKFRHSRVWDGVSAIVPKSIRRMGVRLAETQSNEKLTQEEIDDVYKLLTPVFQEKVAELHRLTGKDFSTWNL
ncbi:sulfotransferase [Hahella sp. CR1]|uniref:sulfotransferase family protein n=1 Tax=Hahella sp. CR1 TaxID=2992807 RepID=UPI002441EE73|nr:sulfotransferase [Hahella sp. CR1]MDG9667857.1 sulfotransferase [Hahella sp. CR1]